MPRGSQKGSIFDSKYILFRVWNFDDFGVHRLIHFGGRWRQGWGQRGRGNLILRSYIKSYMGRNVKRVLHASLPLKGGGVSNCLRPSRHRALPGLPLDPIWPPLGSRTPFGLPLDPQCLPSAFKDPTSGFVDRLFMPKPLYFRYDVGVPKSYRLCR